ncbi:OLC1v1010790C1 [Oldenlandia corymbosa var. corymbosa]|uniref:OLC1v1010790C1 n=1 Tax=Oldenlandia corymbosa var. corymbosa TaxID=529605 RepID=A0AAV1DS68_OLDCO|nr:OLC1v1010790C1 [Oldenlandia corymbosa var. corymbosa]
MNSKKLHIAILASPGLGHLIPVLVIGNRLATHHDAKVTVLVIKTSTSAAESQILSLASGPNVEILEIPPPDISHLVDANTKVVARICIMVREALPGVRSAIAGMKDQPDIFIGDLFCTEAFPMAAELNMPKYLYIASNAWFSALQWYTPVLHDEIVGQYVDQTEPLKIPGCKSVRPEDVVDPMLDRNDQVYREYLRVGVEFSWADGILINTWEDLEPVTLEAFRKYEYFTPPVYPIGPFTRPAENYGQKSELMEWLDKQPSESVLYVSFGSGGTLSADQLKELAWGLELSQKRFIWVVRPPAERSDESFFTSGSGPDGSPDFFPEGFLGRTKNIGQIVPQWAPQRQNATMLTEELGVAVRPKVLPTKKVVDRKEIEEMVRTIMESSEEGKAIRDKVRKVKASGENATKAGGSSYVAMNDFLKDVQIRLKSSLAT